jgi:ERCC4-related helicase
MMWLIPRRTEQDIDVRQYVHDTKVETIVLPLTAQIVQVREQFLNVLRVIVEKLFSLKVFYEKNPGNAFLSFHLFTLVQRRLAGFNSSKLKRSLDSNHLN